MHAERWSRVRVKQTTRRGAKDPVSVALLEMCTAACLISFIEFELIVNATVCKSRSRAVALLNRREYLNGTRLLSLINPVAGNIAKIASWVVASVKSWWYFYVNKASYNTRLRRRRLKTRSWYPFARYVNPISLN